MSLSAFVRSTWFTGLFRGAVIVWTFVIVPAGGYALWVLNNVQQKQVANENQIVAVQGTLATRATDNERFQAEVRAADADFRKLLGDVAGQVEDIAIDAATTRGIVEEMRRRDGLAVTFPAPDGSAVGLALP